MRCFWIATAAILCAAFGLPASAAPKSDSNQPRAPQPVAPSPAVQPPAPPPRRVEPPRSGNVERPPAARPNRPAHPKPPRTEDSARPIVRPGRPAPSSPPETARRDDHRKPDHPRPRHNNRVTYFYLDGFGYFPYYGYYPYDYPPAYIPYDYFIPAPVAPPLPPPLEDELPEPKPGALRGTNAQSVATAWKYIGYGDVLFSHQQYAEAGDRYRKASEISPQLADAWFRRGFALAAANRFEQSAAAFKRGLQLDSKWPQSDFGLDDLFDRNVAAKKVRLDAVVSAAVQKPTDFDRQFIAGVLLFFDGQTDRAARYFAQAQRVAGGDDSNYPPAFLAKEEK